MMLSVAIRLVAAFAIFIAVYGYAGDVLAQKTSLIKTSKIPHYEGISDQQFGEQTDLYEEKPQGDKHLEFKVRLPKGWRVSNETFITSGEEENGKSKREEEKLATAKEGPTATAVSRRIVGKIRRYYSPNRTGPLSFFEVSSIQLEYEVTARNWFVNYVVAKGYPVEGLLEVNEKRVEALYVVFQEDTSYIVRTVAEINGPRMILASYYLPEAFWEQERAMQERVVSSFKFVLPETTSIEARRTYSFLEMLRLDYPSSWKLMAPSINNIDAMDMHLLNMSKNEKLNGEINVRVVSTELETTLAEEVGYIREDYADRGFTVGELLEVKDDYKINDYIFFNRNEVYKLDTKKGVNVGDFELWLGVMVEDRYYYIITMLTPGREEDFFNWARNIAAYKIVVESLRP